MVTLVDSSVWIDFFLGRDTPQTAALVTLLRTREIRIADLVMAEVLQGFRDDAAHDKALKLLSLPGVLVVSDATVAVEAAANYRKLRTKGFTVRKPIDVLIATRCIVDDMPLLFADRDFDPFVRHLGLRSALDVSGVN